MKQPLSEHKTQLKEIKNWLKKEHSYLDVLNQRLAERDREFKFYMRQYETALGSGKKSFDRNDYLVKQ